MRTESPAYMRILAPRSLLKWISCASLRPLAVGVVVVVAVMSGSRGSYAGGDGGGVFLDGDVVVLPLLLRRRWPLDHVRAAELDEEPRDEGDQQEDDRRQGGRAVEPGSNLFDDEHGQRRRATG